MSDSSCFKTGLVPQATTTGWERSCDHDWQLAISPCVVLDPFLGSGTTALVARRLGRKCIGIELNPTYAELAARRLQQLSLLAEPVGANPVPDYADRWTEEEAEEWDKQLEALQAEKRRERGAP